MSFTHYYCSSRMHIILSRSLISTRWCGLALLGLRHNSSAPAARAGGVVDVDQAAALLRFCCSSLELLWSFVVVLMFGPRREGPVVEGTAAAGVSARGG